MKCIKLLYRHSLILLGILFMHGGMSSVWGQTSPAADSIPAAHDSVPTAVPLLADTLAVTAKDSIPPVITETPPTLGDSLPPAGTLADTAATALDSTAIGLKSDSLLRHTPSFMEKRFIPNPQRALWLSLIIPGAGQIYNRKYWKLPIIYGGFAGCAYALSWNGKMYKDYSQAYLDIMDSNPNTKSYEDLLPPNSSYNEEQLKSTLKRRKDMFRRYRDLSIFAFIGVYLISIIDAYVDAELSNFDITPDLSMKVEPAVIDNNNQFRSNSLKSKSVGLQCVLRF